MLDDHPAIGGVVITSRDVSERVEERTERQRQHEHLVNAEQLAQMGGWEYVPDTETLRWTDGTRRIFEVPDSFEPSLSDAIDFFHETDQPKVEEAVEKCIESGVQYSLDAQVITNERRQRWVKATGKREFEDGVLKISGVIQDITQRKGREQRLEVLSRVLRHNLRNELTSVLGYAEMLQDQLPAEAQDYHSKIVTSAERLLSLGEKSKQFDKALNYNYTTGPVDVISILEDICVEYRETYPDVTIQTEFDAAQAPGNEMAIKLIFEELIDNACKYSDATDPEVNITVLSRDEHRAKISVVDNGPGLPEAEQQVIEDGEETALTHSNGIGLWTTNWLVSELSGNIQVTATEGGGTTVTIKIPSEQSYS